MSSVPISIEPGLLRAEVYSHLLRAGWSLLRPGEPAKLNGRSIDVPCSPRHGAMMHKDQVARFGISLSRSLLKELDRMVRKKGYRNRSLACILIRDTRTHGGRRLGRILHARGNDSHRYIVDQSGRRVASKPPRLRSNGWAGLQRGSPAFIGRRTSSQLFWN